MFVKGLGLDVCKVYILPPATRPDPTSFNDIQSVRPGTGVAPSENRKPVLSAPFKEVSWSGASLPAPCGGYVPP